MTYELRLEPLQQPHSYYYAPALHRTLQHLQISWLSYAPMTREQRERFQTDSMQDSVRLAIFFGSYREGCSALPIP